MTPHRSRALARLAGATALAIGIAAAPAQAALTSPAPDSVQRGDVVATEATGGTASNTCTALGRRAESTITITRQADSQVVFQATKPDRGGWSTTWLTEGEQPGIYRITSTARNRSTFCTLLAPVTLSSFTFEYRPWEHRFADVLDGGSVAFNTSSKEIQATIGDAQSAIVVDEEMEPIVLPKDFGDVALPEDPGSFQPPTSPAECESNPDACEQRLVVIDYEDEGQTVRGVFDLRDKDFVAAVRIGDRSAVLKSLGEGDEVIGELEQEIVERANEAGVDAEQVLDTRVRVTVPDPESEDGGTKTVNITVREGIELVESSDEPGVGTSDTSAVNAGSLLHIALNTGARGAAAPYQSVTSSRRLPTTPPAIVPGVTPNPADPTNPQVGLLAFSPGGPLRQVRGRYAGGTHTVGSSALGSNVDTSPGATGPDGQQYPAWLPVLTGGTISDTAIDFTGYAIVSNTETCILPTFCIGVGVIIGTGAAQFGDAPAGLPRIAEVEDEVDANSPVPLPETPATPEVPLPELPDAPELP